jgi:hypothetical protein
MDPYFLTNDFSQGLLTLFIALENRVHCFIECILICLPCRPIWMWADRICAVVIQSTWWQVEYLRRLLLSMHNSCLVLTNTVQHAAVASVCLQFLHPMQQEKKMESIIWKQFVRSEKIASGCVKSMLIAVGEKYEYQVLTISLASVWTVLAKKSLACCFRVFLIPIHSKLTTNSKHNIKGHTYGHMPPR